jgi:Sperm-tail PG-rich repeat
MKSSAFAFGSESRIPPPSKDAILNPGPGQYNLPPKAKGPKYIIGMKLSESKRDLSPGPGQYNQDAKVINQKSPSYTMIGRPGSS